MRTDPPRDGTPPESAADNGRRRREPWPWIVAGLLTFMIAASLSFFAIAASHPDPPVTRERTPGLEAP